MIERMNRYENTFTGAHRAQIFFQTWQVDQVEQSQGTVVITHGLAEHSECYHPLALALNEAKWNVIGWDLRGHGKSEGKRGYVKQFDDYCIDLQLLTTHCRNELTTAIQKKPWVLLGHSMGGLIALKTLIAYGDMGYRALCLSSPLLEVAVKVPVLKQKFAQWAGHWWPTLTLYNELRYEDLSHIEEIVKSYPKDPLRHDKISPQVFLGMLENFHFVPQNAGKIQIPVLLQLSGQDKIVSTPAAEDFFHLLSTPKKKKYIYPESFHEIYNDLERELALRHLKEFLNDLR